MSYVESIVFVSPLQLQSQAVTCLQTLTKLSQEEGCNILRPLTIAFANEKLSHDTTPNRKREKGMSIKTTGGSQGEDPTSPGMIIEA